MLRVPKNQLPLEEEQEEAEISFGTTKVLQSLQSAEDA